MLTVFPLIAAVALERFPIPVVCCGFFTATDDPFHPISLISAEHTWRSVASGRTQKVLSHCNALMAFISTVPHLESGFEAEYILLVERGICTRRLVAIMAFSLGGNVKGCVRLKLESWKT